MEQRLFIIIAWLFILGAAIIFVSSFFTQDRRKTRELWIIYCTEIVIVGAIIVPAYIGGLTFAIVMTLIGLVALWELYHVVGMWAGLSQEHGSDRRPETNFPLLFKLIGMGSGVVIFASAYWFDSTEAIYLIVPIASLVLFICNIVMPMSPSITTNLGLTQLGIIYPALFFAHIILIGNQPQGFALIVFLYVVVEANDAFALLFGKLWGHRKIFSQLSPKKTLEGTASGIVCALLVAVGLSELMPQFTWVNGLLCGVLIVAFTIIGDLAASKLKRNVGVKDFGYVLPRQGGVLDIYDSLIFVTPIFYWYVRIFM